jgi:probable HAF family extracellular repeat protein
MRKGSWLVVCLLLLLSPFINLQSATIVAIPTLGGNTTPYAVNAAGQVVGQSETASTTGHAFLFSGGTTIDLNGAYAGFSVGYDINRAGDVIGYYTGDGSLPPRPFLYRSGALTDLGTLGGPMGIARQINDNGTIAGYSYNAAGASRAFRYTQGSLYGLPTLGGNAAQVPARCLNASNWIAGESSLPDGTTHACLWTDTQVIDLGPANAIYSTATDINDFGWVGGYYLTENYDMLAFLYDGSTTTSLGSLGGGGSIVYVVNNLGQAAGDSYTETGNTHGFLFTNGIMADLGSLGSDYSSVRDMNNSGQIIGESMTADGFTVPVLWENGTLTPLANLLPADSGWQLTTADRINDAGQIIGTGSLNGQPSAYLLTLRVSTPASNRPPVAAAGRNQTVEATGPQTTVTLNGSASSDPDGDTLRYAWYYRDTLLSPEAVAPLNFTLGTYHIKLRVTDPSGATDQDSVTIKVVDTTAPVFATPVAVTLAANNKGHAVIPDFLADLAATDNCTPANKLKKTQCPRAGSQACLGVTTVRITVTDASGNDSTCATKVTVKDTTPPVIKSVTANPSSLRASDKKMVPVTLCVEARDNCDCNPSSRIISVTSSEPVTGGNDKTSPDWQITGALKLKLRAEEQKDRTYTITVCTTDDAGNTSTATLQIKVKNSRR